MNIVSTIMKFLAPVIIARIATATGLSQSIVGKIVAAAIPAILAGMTGAANRSGGGGLLDQILGKQDPSVLDNFGSMLGGPGQQQMVESGLGSLRSLLGGSSTDALAGALGKFAGAGAKESGSLLGMLAPVVLGSLAKEKKSSGLDAGGLVQLLNGQKNNIAAAMPAGFSDLLKGTGLLDSVAGSLKSVASPTSPAAERKPVYPGNMAMYRLLLPAALAALALYWIGNRAKTPVVLPPPAAEEPSATRSLAAPVGEAQVKSMLDTLKGALDGITDEATARANFPKLQDASAQLEKIKTAASAMAPEARRPIADLIGAQLPGLAQTADRLLSNPAIAGILKPILDQLVQALTALSKP
jgi:hypothetical protein